LFAQLAAHPHMFGVTAPHVVPTGQLPLLHTPPHPSLAPHPLFAQLAAHPHTFGVTAPHVVPAGQVPVQTPPWQLVPTCMQGLLLVQIVVSGLGVSGEHSPVVGEHVPGLLHWSLGQVTAFVRTHAPALEHVPEPRQRFAGEQSAPVVTVHAPVSHVWQVPQPLAPQQWLPTQNPDWHSGPAAQNAPGPFWPHTPFKQRFGDTQSSFVSQALLHADESLLHLKATHASAEPPPLHTPAPLQVLARVPEDPPAGQDCATHWVVGEYLLQAPAPLQLPLLPHVVGSDLPHRPLGSALPAGVGVHVPFVAVQVWQGPSQATLQQTCSRVEHTPIAHWFEFVQAPPGGSRPHDVPRHVLLGAHETPGPHVDWHAFAAPHVYGAHVAGRGVWHAPAPSQVDCPVNVVPVVGHVGSLHFVPAA
jgi:hypothetical protein